MSATVEFEFLIVDNTIQKISEIKQIVQKKFCNTFCNFKNILGTTNLRTTKPGNSRPVKTNFQFYSKIFINIYVHLAS